VDVAIQQGHQIVDRGPYAAIRHPAYAGSLLSFGGLALCTSSWVGAALLLVPIGGVFLYRIRVEEAALREALGETYARYASRTARLVPGIY